MTRFCIPHLLHQSLGYFESGANNLHVLFRCGNPMLALLLEAVQDEYRFLELHRIDRAICAASVIFDDLKHTGTTKAFKRFRRIMLIASLSKRQREPKKSPHVNR